MGQCVLQSRLGIHSFEECHTRDKKADEQTQEAYAERKLWSYKTFKILQTLSFCTWKRVKQAWMSGAEEHTCEKHIYALESEWI